MQLYHWKVRQSLKCEGATDPADTIRVLEKNLHCIIPPTLDGQISLSSLILEDAPEAEKLDEIYTRMHPDTRPRLGRIKAEGIRLHEGLEEVIVDSSVLIPDRASLPAAVEYCQTNWGYHALTPDWLHPHPTSTFKVRVYLTLFGPVIEEQQFVEGFYKTIQLPIVPACGMTIRFAHTGETSNLSEASAAFLCKEFKPIMVSLSVDVDFNDNLWHENTGSLHMMIDASAPTVEDFYQFGNLLISKMGFSTNI